MSEKTQVDFSPEDLTAAAQSKLFEEKEPFSSHTLPAKGDEDVLTAEDYPDGGRGWLVVIGCVVFAATTLGWAYVLDP